MQDTVVMKALAIAVQMRPSGIISTALIWGFLSHRLWVPKIRRLWVWIPLDSGLYTNFCPNSVPIIKLNSKSFAASVTDLMKDAQQREKSQTLTRTHDFFILLPFATVFHHKSVLGCSFLHSMRNYKMKTQRCWLKNVVLRDGNVWVDCTALIPKLCAGINTAKWITSRIEKGLHCGKPVIKDQLGGFKNKRAVHGFKSWFQFWTRVKDL